jgi:hypothetical protein
VKGSGPARGPTDSDVDLRLLTSCCQSVTAVMVFIAPPSVWGEADRSVVMRSPCLRASGAGAALDPP